jgi:hypothetical protein
MFTAKRGQAGGYLKLGIASPMANKLEWFLEGDVKTDGWVSGNVSLESLAQCQFGLNWLY